MLPPGTLPPGELPPFGEYWEYALASGVQATRAVATAMRNRAPSQLQPRLLETVLEDSVEDFRKDAPIMIPSFFCNFLLFFVRT